MRPAQTLLASAIAVSLLALPLAAQADEPAVNGQITLPEGATLEDAGAWTLLVEDTTVADAPAVVIGAAAGAVADASATTIDFNAPFDPDAIDDAASYTLNARIVTEGGELLFVNDTVIPVITGGAPIDGVDVPVVAVAAGPTDGARVIELEADAALRFLQEGEQVMEIPVSPGETVVFRIDNTAGFEHNFYIGADEELAVPSATTEIGLPDWVSGVQELEWVVPDDIEGLRFACTVPGHYVLMQGDFVVAP